MTSPEGGNIIDESADGVRDPLFKRLKRTPVLLHTTRYLCVGFCGDVFPNTVQSSDRSSYCQHRVLEEPREHSCLDFQHGYRNGSQFQRVVRLLASLSACEGRSPRCTQRSQGCTFKQNPYVGVEKSNGPCCSIVVLERIGPFDRGENLLACEKDLARVLLLQVRHRCVR